MGTVVENISSLKAVKADIKAAIEDKGVDMSNVPFTGYAQKIGEITTGGTTGSLALVDGTKFTNSTFTTIPDYYDFSNITDGGNMFLGCTKLVTINNLNLTNANEMGRMFENCENLQSILHLDSSNATNMYGMFISCKSLQSIPELDTSNVTNMNSMFLNCMSITTIPQLDTSNVTTMNYMFSLCGSLQTIPSLNTSNVTNMSNMFQNCRSLQSIPSLNTSNVTNIFSLFGGTDLEYLTDVGGWINLNINWSDGYGLVKCPNLTYQSCINILNGLADVTELGSRTLKVHQNFLDTVGDEISIGTAKGWTISA